MNQLVRKLAIQTLDYDERIEYTLLYFTNDWSELIGLLTEPRAFYKRLFEEFGYDDSTDRHARLPWVFANGPITAVIRNSLNRPEATAKMFSIASNEPFENFSIDQTLIDDSSLESMLIDAAPEQVHKGAFLAEFALDTRTLLITYCPPRVKPQSSTYKGVYSRVNIALSSTRAGTPDDLTRDYGSLHFDITQDATARAEFAVAFLENPKGVCESLIERARSTERRITVGNQRFSDPGIGVRVARPDELGDEEAHRIKFMVHPQPSKRGALILEGLDNNTLAQGMKDGGPTIGPPCTESIIYRSGSNYLIDTMIVKDYALR